MQSDYIKHHGILGQKWGVRRFQRTDGRLTPAGEKHRAERFKKKEDQKEQKPKKQLTDEQKKAIKIGLAVSASIIGVYGGYRLYQNYKYKDSETDSKTGLQLKKKHYTPDEDMKAVNQPRFLNPFFDFAGHFSNNCALCTATYELRRRGYDVKAGEERHGKTGYDFSQIFKISKSDIDKRGKDLHGTTDFLNKAKDMGPNARGALTITSMLGGHSIVWENDANGKTIIRDCQLNKKMTNLKEINNYFNLVGMTPVWMMRYDDLQINKEGVSGKRGVWARNSKDIEFGLSELEGLLATSGTAVLAGAATGKYVYDKDRYNKIGGDNDDSGTSESNREKETSKER